MPLSPKEFKILPKDFYGKISNMPTCPLILIKENGDITYGGQHKNKVIEDYDEGNGDVLLFAWTGKWRTDMFIVTQEDLDKHYK